MKPAREWAQRIWSDEGPLVNGWDEVERIVAEAQTDAREELVEIAKGVTTYPGRGPKRCKWCKGKPAHRDGAIEHDWHCPTEVARRALVIVACKTCAGTGGVGAGGDLGAKGFVRDCPTCGGGGVDTEIARLRDLATRAADLLEAVGELVDHDPDGSTVRGASLVDEIRGTRRPR